MDPSEYEHVVADIAHSVFARAEGFPSENVLVGANSRFQGASGFTHQIDVAIRGPRDIILVECKHWSEKSVQVDHVLTLIARVIDIQPTLALKIHPVVVTSTQFQSGCYTLAKHYGIDLETIESAGSFAFSYKGISAVGISPESGALAIEGYRPSVAQSVSDPSVPRSSGCYREDR